VEALGIYLKRRSRGRLDESHLELHSSSEKCVKRGLACRGNENMWQITAHETSRPNSSPVRNPNAAPGVQQGPAQFVICYLTKQGRSRLALHKFPSAASISLPGPIPWEDPCWVLEDHMRSRRAACKDGNVALRLHLLQACVIWPRVSGSPRFRLLSHHLAHAVPFAMQAGCLAGSFACGWVLGIQCCQTKIKWFLSS